MEFRSGITRRVALVALLCMAASLPLTGANAAVGDVVGTALIDSTDYAGTTFTLDPGTYTFEATGFYQDTFRSPWSGRFADAECTSMDPDPTWSSNRWGAVSALTRGTELGQDPQDIYINARNVTWKPVSGDASGCDPNHAYTLTVTLEVPADVGFGVYDPFSYTDNYQDGGDIPGITITIVEAAAPTGGGGGPSLPGLNGIPVGAATVSASSASPRLSPIPLLPGLTYEISVAGSYLWDYRTSDNVADAECSRTTADSTFLEDRFAGTPGWEEHDLLDLYVNDTAVDWGDCNASHTYTLTVTPDEPTLLSFVVKSPFYGYMAGSLDVLVTLVG